MKLERVYLHAVSHEKLEGQRITKIDFASCLPKDVFPGSTYSGRVFTLENGERFLIAVDCGEVSVFAILSK